MGNLNDVNTLFKDGKNKNKKTLNLTTEVIKQKTKKLAEA
jgi:hypothetical protein